MGSTPIRLCQQSGRIIYQVCQKWLKDRPGRALSYDDLLHYQRTGAAMAATIRLMAEIDAAIAEHGGWPLV